MLFECLLCHCRVLSYLCMFLKCPLQKCFPTLHLPVEISYQYDLFAVFSCWFLSTDMFVVKFSVLLLERKLTP